MFRDPDVASAVREVLGVDPNFWLNAQSITPFPAIESLTLDANKVSELTGIGTYLTGLKSLEVIPFDRSVPQQALTNNLWGLSVPLPQTSKLTSLTLSHVGLTNTALGTLPWLPELTRLDVRGNELTQIPAQVPANAPRLSTIFVHGNPQLAASPIVGLFHLKGKAIDVDLAPNRPDIATSIADLAARLYYLPLKMLEYVTNTIVYQPYSGAMKGALATFQTRAGNDWDTNSLLAALYAQAGVTTRYVSGGIGGTQAQIDAYVGSRNDTATYNILRAAGIDYDPNPNDTVAYSNYLRHAWLQAYLTVPSTGADGWVSMDASWKFRDFRPGLAGVLSSVPFGALESDYLTNPAWQKKSAAEYYESKVASWLATNHPGLTIADVGYDGPIIQQSFQSLPTGLPYDTSVGSPTTHAPAPTPTTPAPLPASALYTIGVTLKTGATTLFATTLTLDQVALSRIVLDPTISGSNAQHRLKVNGSVVATASQEVLSTADITVKFDITAATGGTSYSREFARKANQMIAVGLDANQFSEGLLAEKRAVANAQQLNRANGVTVNAEQAVGGLLDLAIASYFTAANADEASIAAMTSAVPNRAIVSLGIATSDAALPTTPTIPLYTSTGPTVNSTPVGQLQFPYTPVGLGLDVPANVVDAFAIDATTTTLDLDRNRLLGYTNSSLEGLLIEELTNFESVSTMTAFQLIATTAGGLSNLVEINSGNVSNIATLLPNVRQEIRNAITSYVNNGIPGVADLSGVTFRVLAPKNEVIVGDTATPSKQWKGAGYTLTAVVTSGPNVGLNGKTIGYIIHGAVGGGPLVSYGGAQSRTEIATSTIFASSSSSSVLNLLGDPVNIANGNVYHEETDVTIPNVGTPLAFNRRYDSIHTVSGLAGTPAAWSDRGMGEGWSFSYSDRLEIATNGDITWFTDTGMRLLFTKTGSLYTNPAGVFGTFSGSAGAGFTWKDHDGNVTSFGGTGGGTTSYLWQKRDRFGNGIKVVYVAGTTKLARVEDLRDTSRRLTFSYNAESPQPHISQVTDFTGRTWTYTYSSGRLATATAPTVGGGAPVVQYAYHTDNAQRGLLASVTDPAGKITSWDYYANRRGFLVTDSEGLEHSFTYNLHRRRSAFINERGLATRYDLDDAGNQIAVQHPDRSTERSTWSTNGLKLTSTDVYGQTESYAYDLLTGKLVSQTDVTGRTTSIKYRGVFSDQFNRADASTLGIDWTTAAGGFSVTSGKARSTDGASSLARVSDFAASDVALQADIDLTGAPANAHRSAGFVGRLSADGQTYYLAEFRRLANQPVSEAIIYSVVSGNLTVLAINSSVSSLAGSLRFTIKGPALTLMLNGTTVVSTTNGAIPSGTSGSVGLRHFGVGVTAENFTAEDTLIEHDFSDQFNRTDASTLGSDWTTAAGGFSVTSGKARSTSTTDSRAVVNGFAASDIALEATVDLTGASSTAHRSAGLAGRVSADGQTYYLAEFRRLANATSSELIIYYVSSGTYNVLAINSSLSSLAGRLRFTINGTSLSVSLNGTSVVSTTNAAIPSGTSGSVGLRHYGIGVTAEDFTADDTLVQHDVDTIVQRNSALSALDDVTTTFGYDSTGFMTTRTEDAGAGKLNLTTTYTKTSDGRGLVDSTTSPRGVVTTYVYNGAGQIQQKKTGKELDSPLTWVTEAFNFDSRGNLLTSTDGNGNVTTYTYDALGRKASQKSADPDAAGPLPSITTTYAYDKLGNLISSTLQGPIDGGLVSIGNVGNADSSTSGVGGVSYAYSMAAYETTNAQYVKFLNAVGASNPNGVYDSQMTSDANGGIVQVGTAGQFTYQVKAGLSPMNVPYANVPVTFVDWFDAARYVNWLHNGQQTNPATLEYGSYTLNGATSGPLPSRSTYASYVLPTVDEWAKAAFHTGGASSTAYMIWATNSNSQPTSNVSNTTLVNVANFGGTAGGISGLLPAGSYTNSRSTYGLYEMQGNVAEITETPNPASASQWTAMSGSWGTSTSGLSNFSMAAPPAVFVGSTDATPRIGFRIAKVTPAPGDPIPPGPWFSTSTDRVTNVTYDSRQREVSRTSPDGTTTRTTYDPLGNVASTTDAMGRITQYVYDANGRQVATLHPDGTTTRARIDAGGRVAATIDQLGAVTKFTYDKLGRKVTETLPDPDGSGPLPAPSSAWGYDSRGNVEYVTANFVGQGGVAAGATSRSTHYEYDAIGRMTKETLPDPDGSGPLARSVSQTTYDADGNILTMTDPRGSVTTYAYDTFGRVVSETTADPDGPTGPLVPLVTQYVYDNAGNLARKVAPGAAHINQPAFNTDYTYDRLNRRTSTTLPDPDGTAPLPRPVSTQTFDALGQLAQSTDALGRTTTYAYDKLARVTAVTDPLGATTRSIFDASGNSMATIDAYDRSTFTTYDAMNRPVSIREPRADSATVNAVSTFSYDARGQLVASTDALGRTSWKQYDALGRVTATTDALGAFSGDPAHTVKTEYDSASRVVATIDELGRRTDIAYDNLGRKIRELGPDAGQGRPVTQYGYDLAGNLLYTSDPRSLNTSDMSFEMHDVGTGTFGSFQVAPRGSAWSFTGTAGVAGNGSGFTTGNPAAPDGSQVLYLQMTGSATQTISDWQAGTYVISLKAAKRANHGGTNNFRVQVDGQTVATITPSGTTYGTYTTASFTVTAGAHTITLAGLNTVSGGDSTAFVDDIRVIQAAEGIADVSFEQPDLAEPSYAYTPAGSPWSFAGTAGVATNGSDFTSGNPPAPSGNQVLFLQLTGLATQTITDWQAGTYVISLKAAKRANAGGNNEIRVLVDGQVISTLQPLSTNYETLTTAPFSVSAGTHWITLAGVNGSTPGNTVFVDDVVILHAPATAANGSFEQPAVGAGNFQPTPAGATWAFAGTSGIAANNSPFTGTQAAPTGTQVLYLQMTGAASQTIAGWQAGSYVISMKAAKRANYGVNDFRVLVDGQPVATFASTSTTYEPFVTVPFTVSAGTHTISLAGLNTVGGDNTVFIDDVQIIPTTQNGPDPRFTTWFFYDALGRQTATVDALGPDWPLNAIPAAMPASVTTSTTRTTYDARGRVVATTDELGRATDYELDNLNRTLTATAPAPAVGQPRPVTTYAYDAVGNRTSVTTPLGHVTSYVYDARNRRTKVIDALSTLANPRETVTAYDLLGNTTSVTDASNNVTSYVYDRLNRLVTETDPLSKSATYAYDLVGNKIRETDRLGRVSTFVYDASDRLVEERWQQSSAGAVYHTIKRFYDNASQLLGVTETDTANHAATTAWQYSYDAQGNLIRSRMAPGELRQQQATAGGSNPGTLSSASPTIDWNGNGLAKRYSGVYSFSLTAGQQLLLTVNSTAFDPVLVVQRPGGNMSNWTIDDNSAGGTTARLLITADVTDDWLVFVTARDPLASGAYDLTALIGSGLTIPAIVSDALVEYDFAYDKAGNLIQAYEDSAAVANVAGIGPAVIGLGAGTAYAVDALDHVQRVRLISLGTGAVAKEANYVYRGDGSIHAMNRFGWSNAIGTTTNTFDGMGRLTQITHAPTGSPAVTYGYAFDASSRMQSMTTPEGTNTFGLDATDQLTWASQTDEAYTYDATGNRTSGGTVTGTGNRLTFDGVYRYAYDFEGNRTAKYKDTNAGGVLSAGDTDVTLYAYDQRNRLVSVSHVATLPPNPDSDLAAFTANGTPFPLSDLELRYTYDYADRRIRREIDTDGAAGGTAASISFAAYAKGDRTLEIDRTNSVLTSGGKVIGFAGKVIQRNTFGVGQDEALAVDKFTWSGSTPTGTTFWLFGDHQDSVRDIVSGNAGSLGQIVEHRQFNSFGNIVLRTANVGIEFGYAGRPFEERSGLSDNRARWYEPRTGKFINEDPSGFKGGDANLFRYVGNSPMDMIDPSGLTGIWAGGAKSSYAALPSFSQPDYLSKYLNSGSSSGFSLLAGVGYDSFKPSTSSAGSSSFAWQGSTLSDMANQSIARITAPTVTPLKDQWSFPYSQSKALEITARTWPDRPGLLSQVSQWGMPTNVSANGNTFHFFGGQTYAEPREPSSGQYLHAAATMVPGVAVVRAGGSGLYAAGAVGMAQADSYATNLFINHYVPQSAQTLASFGPFSLQTIASLALGRFRTSGGSVSSVYLPHDPVTGKPRALPQQTLKSGVDIPLPDPRAGGAPHTTLGTRIGSDGIPYRQSATFPGETWPTAAGQAVPWSRVDWTDHGTPWHHPAPHQHIFEYNNGSWSDGPPVPFRY
jgi:RHS repeat-associated protein